MAISVMKNRKLYVGPYDFSGQMNGAALSYGAKAVDATCDGDGSEINEGGLKTVKFELNGLWEDGVADAEFFNQMGLADHIYTLSSQGLVGEPAYFFQPDLGEYTPGGKTGDALPFKVTAGGPAQLVQGIIILPKLARIISDNGTGHEFFSWSDLGQQFSQTAIYSLAYLGSGICLAGTSPGGKILRSTDYGNTWSDLGPQFSELNINSLAYLGGGICLAGTSPGGKILRSIDYGATWSNLGQQFSQTNIVSLAYLGNGICLAGTATDGKILRSTDYGATWSDLGQQFSQTSVESLAHLGSGICLAGTGMDGKILRSTDYGATWSDLGQQFSQDMIISLAYLGNGICLAGTYVGGKILRSTDYGATWSDLGQQFSQTSVASLAYLGSGICLAGTSPGGKILRSIDYGATWSNLGQQFSQASIYALLNLESNISLAGTASLAKILRSINCNNLEQKIYAVLHVFAASGTLPTLDVLVESDNNPDFTSPTTRLTFVQKSVAGYEWQEMAGPITDTWWRVTWGIAGTNPSFTFVVALGIL